MVPMSTLKIKVSSVKNGIIKQGTPVSKAEEGESIFKAQGHQDEPSCQQKCVK